MNDVENIPSILSKLVHHDTYFDEDHGESTLAIVLDAVLEDLPEMLADPVRLIYLEGHTLRGAARMLGIDHKTAKARAIKGVEVMRERLLDTEWMLEMLRGYVPSDLVPEREGTVVPTATEVLNSLKEKSREQE
jgi:hypothetical protein